MKAIWIFLVATIVAAPTVAAAPELNLKPCTIELVDGRVIEGKLAVQFEMPDHLIVYSPRLATVRSFMKNCVHAVTVGGERNQLNAKRELTDAEKELVGQVAWPDEPPAKGPRPAYTTEKWGKPKQLLVWADPGRSGRFEDPKNWLVNGRPMKDWPRPRGEHYGLIFFSKDGTDFLFPGAASRYAVRPRSNARARHIAVQNGADAEISLNACTGNIWVMPGGNFNGGGCAPLSGEKHTFIVNGEPYEGAGPRTAKEFAALMKGGKGLARKWIVKKDDPNASITLIGSFGSGDETHWMRGVTILSENSTISIGGRCTQTIGRDAKLIMRSGSVLGKNGNQLYKDDMRLKGALLAGTPDEPLTRNCYLGLSIKDPETTYTEKKGNRRVLNDHYEFRLRGTGASCHGQGLLMAPEARIAVHTADPDKAKLVITWHGITDMGSDDGTEPGYFDELPDSERTINMVFLEDVRLNDVVLDWVGTDDILMVDPSTRSTWQRISYGKNIRASGDAMVSKFPLTEDTEKVLAHWRQECAENKTESGRWAHEKTGEAYLRILPSGGTFAAGDTVPVRLIALGDREIRYTLDGSGSEDGEIYAGVFELTETTTVKAGCYHNPPPDFSRRWGHVSDTITFIEGVRRPDEPGKTRPGLQVRIYEENGFEQLHDPSGAPVESQTVRRFELAVPDGRLSQRDGYLYTGFVEVDRPGVYRFYTETEGRSRLYIGDRLVVDNHRRYPCDWNPMVGTPLESWGSLRLDPGKHTLRMEYGRGSGFTGWPPWQPQENEPFEVQYEGPGVEKQPIPADALSHEPNTPTAGEAKGYYGAHIGKWFLMKDGRFTITSVRPDLPAEELRWRAWAAAHRINKGPYWPYDAVRDHGKILEHIEVTPLQKRAIDAIVAVARKGGETFEHETKARYRELGALAKEAEAAGDGEKATRYKKMQYVQVHSKLALKRAPFFEILSLLTNEQWDALTEALPKFQELRNGMDAMKDALEASKRSEIPLEKLLAGRDGRQLFQRKSDGALFYLDMRSATMVRVENAAVKHTKYDTWRGGINWDGRRFLYQNGTKIHVVNDDGSERRALVDGANPHWWRDHDSGDDYVVYNRDASRIAWDGDGTGGPPTMRIPVGGGRPEEIWPHCYDAGFSRDGTHIGDAYKGAFIGDRSTGRIYGNLPPDEQHCVGSMLADDSYRLFYEKSTKHRTVVIADKAGRIAWSFARVGTGEIFGEASSNNPDFCIISSSGRKRYYLVRVSTKHYADLGVSLDEYGRIGGPWIGALSD